jgi:hypothetical protein
VNNVTDLLKSATCAHCNRRPVKSRRNTICRSCGAVICYGCQMAHFEEKHGDT